MPTPFGLIAQMLIFRRTFFDLTFFLGYKYNKEFFPENL